MACTNFGTANAYNVFLLGDHTQRNSQAGGLVAVGGNATYTDYSVSAGLPVSPTLSGLVVAGNVNIVRGTNTGNTVIGFSSVVTTYSMNNLNGVGGQPLRDNPLDFAAIGTTLQCSSQAWAALPANGTVTNDFGTLQFRGSDPTLNVFTFDGSNVAGSGVSLASANGINFAIPAGSFVLANILGNNVGFGSYSITFSSDPGPSPGSRILWNVPQATAFFHRSLNIVGSVLAPFAAITANGSGQINGQLIAFSYDGNTNSFQEVFVPYGGCLPEVCNAANLTITKTVNGASTFTGVPGTPITFIVTVTNSGGAALTNVVINDEQLGIMQTVPTIEPGQQYSFTVDSVVRDGKAGTSYSNASTASSDQTAVEEASSTVVIGALPVNVSLVKTPDKMSATTGEEVTYTFTLINNGNTDLQDAVLTDPVLGIQVPLGTVFDGELYTATFRIPREAAPGTEFTNVARLEAANIPAPGFVTAAAVVSVEAAPGVTLTKSAEPEEVFPGDTIRYSIGVTNDSALSSRIDLRVSDEVLGLDKTIAVLPPSSFVSYNPEVTVPANAAAGSKIVNTAVLFGGNGTQEATAEVIVAARPGLLLLKDSDRDFANPGDIVQYILTLINTGNTILSGLQLTDSLTGLNETVPPIAIGGRTQIATSYTIPASTPGGTQIVNTVVAQGGGIGPQMASSVLIVSQVPLPPIPPEPPIPPAVQPRLEVTGTADRPIVFPEESVLFTGFVTNPTGITVRNIVLESPLFQYIGLGEQLLPGQTMELQASFPVAPQTPPGTIITASLSATSARTFPAEASVSVVVGALPRAEIDLTVDKPEVLQNEVVTFQGIAANTGNVVLTNVRIFDALRLRDVTVQRFLVGATLTGRARLTVHNPPGSIVEDTVILTANELASPLSDTVALTVYGLLLHLSAVPLVVAVGDEVAVALTVSNPSPSPATEIRVRQLVPAGTASVADSLRVNGEPRQEDPAAGVGLGSLATGQSAVITYKLTVTTEPQGGSFDIQAAAAFFFPATARRLRGESRSNAVKIVVEEGEE